MNAANKRFRFIRDDVREMRFKNESKEPLVKCMFCQQMLKKNYESIQAHVDEVHKTEGAKPKRKPIAKTSTIQSDSSNLKRPREDDVDNDKDNSKKKPVVVDRHFCPICGRGFDFPHRLVGHLELVHKRFDDGSTNHACTICRREFKFARLVENHILSTHEHVLYCCLACGASFSVLQHLETHMTKKHEPLLYACKICRKTFFYTYDLQTHVDLVHAFEANDALLVCRKCGRNFAFISALEEHERGHDKTVNDTTIRLPALPKGFFKTESAGKSSDSKANLKDDGKNDLNVSTTVVELSSSVVPSNDAASCVSAEIPISKLESSEASFEITSSLTEAPTIVEYSLPVPTLDGIALPVPNVDGIALPISTVDGIALPAGWTLVAGDSTDAIVSDPAIESFVVAQTADPMELARIAPVALEDTISATPPPIFEAPSETLTFNTSILETPGLILEAPSEELTTESLENVVAETASPSTVSIAEATTSG